MRLCSRPPLPRPRRTEYQGHGFYISVTSQRIGLGYVCLQVARAIRPESVPRRCFHMYRLTAIAVLLAATAFQPSLEAQMRAARPNIPIRTSVGGFRGGQSPGRSFSVVRPRPHFGGGQHVFIRPGFRRGFRINIFFGNSCFTSSFFDPFFCQQFFFPNRFLFAQPVYIPYPIYSAPSYQVADSTPTPTADYSDLRTEVGRLTSEVEQLRQEQALREQPRQPSSPPSPVVENTPTILVFRIAVRFGTTQL